jgi:small subunit ribosomal protein S18
MTSHSKKRSKCFYCNNDIPIDYKDVENLKKFISPLGKIFSRKVTGICAKHQRRLAKAIKKARVMALLPFVKEG